MRKNELLLLSENHFWTKIAKAARTITPPGYSNTKNNNGVTSCSNIEYTGYGKKQWNKTTIPPPAIQILNIPVTFDQQKPFKHQQLNKTTILLVTAKKQLNKTTIPSPVIWLSNIPVTFDQRKLFEHRIYRLRQKAVK